MGPAYGWWGPWMMPFMWIFPIFGIIIMLICLYVFVNFLRGRGPFGSYFREGFKGRRRCPSCKSSIEDDFLVCPYCGSELSSICPHCKRNIDPSWGVCPYCKTSLKKES